MKNSLSPAAGHGSSNHLLLAYVADLELEVDRLRRQARFLQYEAQDTVKQIRQWCTAAKQEGNPPATLAGIEEVAQGLAAVLSDLHEPPGYHPAHDQVIAIALRPLAKQAFRWQQRLENAPNVALRLELTEDYIEWFPARLRHILDNLFSNALKYRDPDKAESWVCLEVRAAPQGYEVRLSDNGLGLPAGEPDEVLELFYRAAPARAAGLGVGLAVVKLLVEKSGGSLTVRSGEGQGTTFIALLPRYDTADFLI
jgi:signal transduction histidine kinase